MPIRRTVVAPFALALATLAGTAGAETLYKLIDKSGRVTYTQDKPKEFDGQVIPVEIDMNANKATLPKFTPPPAAAKPAAPSRDSLALARQRVESARGAYEDARDNPRDDDARFIGNAGGGTRRVFTEEYLQRLARLENELKDAEADLRKLQGGR
jgi:hypothetical protein